MRLQHVRFQYAGLKRGILKTKFLPCIARKVKKKSFIKIGKTPFELKGYFTSFPFWFAFFEGRGDYLFSSTQRRGFPRGLPLNLAEGLEVHGE